MSEAASQQPQVAPSPARARASSSAVASFLRHAALTVLAGLMLAGIVHIVTVLLIPTLSERDAMNAYASLGGNGTAELIANRQGPTLLDGDPYAVVAVCSYDLSAGAMRVVARTGGVPFGITLHRRGGGVIYGITDRAAVRGVLEFVVVTEDQRDERIAREEEAEGTRELRVLSDSLQGLIVVRALAKRPSDRPQAEALVTSVACGLAD